MHHDSICSPFNIGLNTWIARIFLHQRLIGTKACDISIEMSRFKKLEVLAVLPLLITIVSGFFMDPLLGSGLVGVRARGFPFAWITQVVYPGALPQFLWEAFFADYLIWLVLISIVYFAFRRL